MKQSDEHPEQPPPSFDYHSPLYANATLTIMLFFSFLFDWQIRHNVTEAASEEMVSFLAAECVHADQREWSILKEEHVALSNNTKRVQAAKATTKQSVCK